MTNNDLSVIMPNYNYGQHIAEALESVLSQSFPAGEIIVLDDGSTDDSVSIVQNYMKKHPNIRLLRNDSNMGLNYTLNRGLHEAKGEYFYAASSDDIVLPGFFERSMDMLNKYPQAGLCFCDWASLEKGRTIENRAYLSDKPVYFDPDEFEKILLRNEYTVIGGSTVIKKRAALIEAGGYLPELKAASDIFAHHVICFRHGACYIPEVFTLMRRHENQYSSKKFRPLDVELGMVRFAMDTVMSPGYEDVLPRFKRTAPFSHSSWDVLKLVLGTKKYRGFFSLKLLRYALFDRFIRRLIIGLLPMDLWRNVLGLYRKLRFRLTGGRT